jgi:hypothetical protein
MNNSEAKDKTISKEPESVISFTTSRKNRGNSPVRRRCLQFIDSVRALGYDKAIPLEDAIELFQSSLGIVDRASVRAYFGVQLHTVRTRMQSHYRYVRSGTCGVKTIEITRDIKQKAGYLELLRLAQIEKKGNNWFMILYPSSIVPQLAPTPKEGVCCSNVGLSLSPNTQNYSASGNHLEPCKAQPDATTTDKQQHTL